MFCHLKSYAKCKNIDNVKRYLFEVDDPGENWLNDCQASLSPCGSLLVFGRHRKITILSIHWDNVSNSSLFTNLWEASLFADVASLLSFQILTEGSKETVNDWICIVVGFKTGEVGFYTERGQLLLLEKFDNSPVLQIKCHVGLHSNDTDEIYVLYNDNVCCLTFSNLLHILRYAKQQMIKGQNISLREPFMEGQNLLSRKLAFSNQDIINDASVIGLELSNTYDHLLTAAIHGGYFTGYRSVAPHNTVIVGVGARPYIGFHQALEGGNAQPILNDVARAVASKIKSALPGWLGGGKSRSDNTAISPPSSDRMLCRYFLNDLHRKGTMSILSPDRRLLAVVDSLGRVVIVDVRRGIAVRMFKGYRNCQCGFLQVNEDVKKHKGMGRKALFIVLYMGKHGLLEVWPLRGPRTVAFSVANNARLFYYTHDTPHKSKNRTCMTNNSMLALLDPEGNIKHIAVPFHFALNNEDSDRSRDTHLVKKLRQFVKEKENDFHESKNNIITMTKELKTTEIKIHCIEMMANNKNISPEILLLCIKTLYITHCEEHQNVTDVNRLNTLCKNLYSILILFISCNNIQLNDQNILQEKNIILKNNGNCLLENSDFNSVPEIKGFQYESLSLTDFELDDFQKLLNFALSIELKRTQHAKVTFKDEKNINSSEFIACFNLLSDENELMLKNNLSEESLIFVSQQIFDSYILGKIEWKGLEKWISQIKIFSPKQFCELLLLYWMHMPIQEITKLRMEKFENILYDLCHSVGIRNVYIGYNEVSPWWQSVRHFLVHSFCPFRSMVSAQLCRSIANKLEKEVENKQNDLEEDLWESLSKDNAQWGLLIGKLDDISLLSIILSQKLETCGNLPAIPMELPEINLKYIFSNGKGSISELTAMWLCIAGINIEDIIESTEGETDFDFSDNKKKTLVSVQFDTIDNECKIDTLSDKLKLLRKQFPFSLSSGNVISNMCWEYIKHWSKNIENLTYLEASLKCLKCIKPVNMQCGMCSMMWSTYLLYPFESACKLISKVGKLPRERLCKQNIGVSDIQLLKFLEYVTEFLDIFLCCTLSEKETNLTIQFEDMWEESKLALTELAVTKSDVHVDILQLHYQLCAAIYYQCFLGSNFWKHVSNLFDIESQKCMFGVLNNIEGFHHQLTDSRVMMQRNNFLFRLVQKCVDLAKERNVWIERIQDLARLWRVNDDLVRREHITCLYAKGLDAEAEEALVSITDFKPLLDTLIPIAGRRLKHFIDSVHNRGDVISILNPQITTYLQSLEDMPNEILTVKSLEATRRLIELVITHYEQQRENNFLKIAQMLLESCVSIQEDLGLGK